MINRFALFSFSIFLFLGSDGQGETFSVEPVRNGVEMRSHDVNLRVQFYARNIVRVLKWKAAGTDRKVSLSVVLKDVPEVPLTNRVDGDDVVLSTDLLTVAISKLDGRIAYAGADAHRFLREGRSEMTTVAYGNDTAFSVTQRFILSAHEGVYGLGQHQDGYMNYRGRTVKLVQSNTQATVPFLVSTNNYGILWDNYSKTIYADDGRAESSFWSDVADNIDYYLVRGGDMDAVIAGYRTLTGQAPLYGKWAYGYWQSKEHYHRGGELMEVAKEYRRRRMPIDNIIQDWDYWNGRQNWSGMFFDSTLFPHPRRMIDSLHAMRYHMMISIWPALGPATAIYRAMEEAGYLYPPVGWGGFKYYDAFNPKADALYWKYLKKGILSKGVDALWLDSTEPDIINANTKESTEYEMKRLGSNHLGTWARYLNAFSLVMTDALYAHWRREMPGHRCYILTRSTFAGQQRNAATTWSGDIGASWEIYKRQIPAGINHCMSGVPYWTFDIGAFVLGAYEGVFCNGGKDPAYQELYARMFQLGAFSPIFRSHGSETPREIWEMGEFVQPILKFDELRYRLLPYTYSMAWKITRDGYTIMRGLPMDFPHDTATYRIGEQFMFGPSLLVCPVTHYMYHPPPEPSVLVSPEFFRTDAGTPGIMATYCSDSKHMQVTREEVEPDIDVDWYTGRPSYVTDSSFSIRWEGNLLPPETGLYQFHMKSYDAKRLILDGRELPIVYTSVEQYTDTVRLEGGKAYRFVLETENSSPGAARMRLFWKTPSIFAGEREQKPRPKEQEVYLPKCEGWYDFWTGEKRDGGERIEADAPIDKIPLFVRAGAILPMGPFLQYSTEKPADPIELRIYPGADGRFVLYEDENDNYDYEKGAYATIEFAWDDARRTLTISDRKGHFPGMLKRRKFDITLVSQGHGGGIDVSRPDGEVRYEGKRIELTIGH